MTRWAGLALLLGLVLRGLACTAYELPRGDVLLDVGVARSLSHGQGFASGFTRGVVRVAGDDPLPQQGLADQHAPLWPLLGALFTPLTGSPFAALKLLSMLSGLGLLLVVMRMADRLGEDLPDVPGGLPLLAAALVALCLVSVDASANGSLYALQALLLLLLVEGLAAPRPAVLLCGCLLGALLQLNHQMLVLVALPVLVLAWAARPGERRAALGSSGLTLLVALLLQLPWWWRNASVFGSPLHSVNGLYLLYWAGAPLHFGIEAGQPVWRLGGDIGVLGLARAALGFVPMNALYLLGAGLVLWPGLLGCALARAPENLLVRGPSGVRDRRRLGLGLAAGLLLAVALCWPAAKLRYLVGLSPLVVLLGLDAMLHRPGRVGRLAALGVGVVWLGAVLSCLLSAPGADRRLPRLVWLALGGGVLMLWPLGRALRQAPLRRGLLLWSGLPLCAVLSLAVGLGPGPGTAYHGTYFLPDVFGQQHEQRAAERGLLLAHARRAALAAGVTRVAGPIELLAWPTPALVELPDLPAPEGRAALRALLDAERIDGLVRVGRTEGESSPAPAAGRLVALGHWDGELGTRVELFVRADG